MNDDWVLDLNSVAPLAPMRWRAHLPPERLLAAADWTAESGQPLLVCVDRRDGIDAAWRADLAGTLSPAEQQRHDAYRRWDDQDRFLLGRGLMRRLLGVWMDQQPRAIAITLGPHGKPQCPGGPQFNVSHSGDLILLAVHGSRPVGVDVEQHRPGIDWEPIARRMFSTACVEDLQRCSAGDQTAAFLQAWCRLEAGLKAGGCGLVALPAPGLDEQLRVWSLCLPHGYAGALALLRP